MSTSPAPSRPRAERLLVRRDPDRLLVLDRDPTELTDEAEVEGTDGAEGTAAAGAAASPQTVQ
jgi:hypothetical protein